MVNAVENDRMFYDLTLGRARRDGDQRTLKTLLKIGRPPYAGRPVSVARKTAKIDLPKLAVHERRHRRQRRHPHRRAAR